MKPNSSPSSPRPLACRRASILRLCLGGCLVLSASAATWDGDSFVDANWSTADNWDNNTAPATGADLVFSGESNISTTNDLDTATAGTFAVNSITFAADAGPFILAGNNVNLSGKTITNLAPNVEETSAKSLDFNIEANNGFTVETPDGDLEIRGSLNTTTGFNRPINKNGPGKLVFQGSQNTSWALNVNAGTLQIYNANNGGQVTGFSGSVATGASLIAESGDILHNGARVQLNGTYDMAAAGEQLGVIYGNGLVTNHGDGSAVTTLRLNRYGSQNGTDTSVTTNYTWSGTIQDGGNVTAVQIEGANRTRTVTFAGTNTYTGNTTFAATTESFVLADTGSLKFKPRANGVNTAITATNAQTTGTVAFNGTFNIDLSEADKVHNNSWTLVDATKLNETYGATFSVAAPFTESSPGVWTYADSELPVGTWTFTEATGVLLFQEPAGRPPVTTWDGGGADGNWSTAANWDVEVLSGDDLIFTGSTRLTNTNDLDTGWDTVNSVPGAVAIDSFKFDANAGAFTIGGNEIYYDNKTILNESAATQTLNCPIRVANGLTVHTPAGNIVLGGSMNVTEGFNKPFTKTGPGTLVLNGTQNTSWALNVNAGTLQVLNPNSGGQVMGYSATIAAGATLLADSGDVFHSNARPVVNGTLNLGADERAGGVTGTGIVTNHGDGSGVTTLTLNPISAAGTETWSGSLRNGGNVTALEIAGPARTVSFAGTNTYTGDTLLSGSAPSFQLAGSGSMIFKPGANGASNKIACTGSHDDGGGNLIPGQDPAATTLLDGKFILDLTGASIANGNSWTLVDAPTLNETYGATFQLMNSTYVPATEYRVNSGTGTFGSFDEDDSHASGGGNYANANAIDTSGVTDPAPAEVYQSERNGNFTCTFPGLGAGAAYTVRLHFAEIFHSAVGSRRFNVLINGTPVLSNYDIYSVAGAKNKAVVESIPVTASEGGSIAIQFVTVTDNAKVSGIEIVPVPPGGSGTNFVEAADVWTMVDGANTWTFSEATGVLSLASGGGSNNYTTWASANGIPGEPASGDFDKDGLTNLMEYALGKSPTASSVPAGTYTGGAVSFPKGAAAVANGDVTWAIEESDDLGATDPWQSVTPTMNNGSAISYTLPPGKPKVFVRLLVGQPGS